MKEQIKSQKEADKVFSSLVKTTISQLKISKDQAEKRIRALLDSGILDGGHPEDSLTQMKIDAFLQTEID